MQWKPASAVGSTRKGSGAAEAKAKRTHPRPPPLPQAARLALTQYTNTACVSNTILAYLPRITRNTRSNDLSSLNTKLRLEVGRLYALVPLTYFWKSLLPNSACVQSRRSPLLTVPLDLCSTFECDRTHARELADVTFDITQGV